MRSGLILLILPHRVILITAFIASPLLLLSSLLHSLFDTADPMDSFVTVTGRSTRGGGSSYASSSRAAGKAPAIPQKRVSNRSSGRKRKHSKMTANMIDLESLTYHESESESEPAPLPSRPAYRIKLNEQWYRRVDDIASRRRSKKKSSHIWGKGKGFAMVHEATGVKYYYCCQCLDEKKDKTYKPLSKRLC